MKKNENSVERESIVEAESTVGLVDHEVVDEKKPIAGEASVKKRRRRKPLGHLFTKRARQPMHASPQKTVNLRSNHLTSDSTNELLNSTANCLPEKPIEEPQHSRNLVKSSEAMPSIDSRRLALDESELAANVDYSTKFTSIVFKPATAMFKQVTKSKSRNELRSITQIKNPRKRVTFETNPLDEFPLQASEVNVESNHVTTVSGVDTQSVGSHSGRYPLSNITNSTADPVVAQTKTNSTQNSTQDTAAMKTEDTSRKNPLIAKNKRSRSQVVVTKPGTKSTSAAARPRMAFDKIAKAPAKIRKTPISSIKANESTGFLADNPAFDSDDPLSGPSNARFKKPLKAVDEFA